MPDPSHKFQTKDLGKGIADKASAGRIKFAKVDGISVDAVVRPAALLKKLTMEQWNEFEKPLKRKFEQGTDELEKSVAKFVAKKDDELKNAAQDMYELFLKPINIQLEHKFEEQCQRIHSTLERELEDLLKESKITGCKASEAKIDIGFEFTILQSSAKRVISSSSSTAPAVKPSEASKEMAPATDHCEASLRKIETVEKDIRKAIIDAEKALSKALMEAKGGGGPKKELDLKDCRACVTAYRNAISDLDAKVLDLDLAIDADQEKQELWKKRLSATKPTEKNYAEMKTAIVKVIGSLEELSKSCKKVRGHVTSEGADRLEAFEKSIETLAQATVVDARLAAAIAPARTTPSFLREVGDLLVDVKKTTGEVQSKLKQLQKLSQAAAAG